MRSLHNLWILSSFFKKNVKIRLISHVTNCAEGTTRLMSRDVHWFTSGVGYELDWTKEEKIQFQKGRASCDMELTICGRFFTCPYQWKENMTNSLMTSLFSHQSIISNEHETMYLSLVAHETSGPGDKRCLLKRQNLWYTYINFLFFSQLSKIIKQIIVPSFYFFPSWIVVPYTQFPF
jgi:hypothetical protein